jgi:hypothetical protein
MQTRTRVVGSGFTTVNYRGKAIMWLDAFSDSGQRPVGAGMEVVHPIGDLYPREIVTARALNAGSITFTIRELWNEPVWWQLTGLEGSATIVDVWNSIAAEPGDITAQMLIKPPGSNTYRGKTYHNLVITDVSDDENVSIGALTVPRTITAAYTHATPIP